MYRRYKENTGTFYIDNFDFKENHSLTNFVVIVKYDHDVLFSPLKCACLNAS